jgi:hypothetical protein
MRYVIAAANHPIRVQGTRPVGVRAGAASPDMRQKQVWALRQRSHDLEKQQQDLE